MAGLDRGLVPADLSEILGALERQRAAVSVEDSDAFWLLVEQAGFRLYGLWGSDAAEGYGWHPLRIPAALGTSQS